MDAERPCAITPEVWHRLLTALDAGAPTPLSSASSAPTAAEVARAISVLRRVARSPYIPTTPTVRQAAFLVAAEAEVLFTGSGGCGKTLGLLMAALADVDRPGYRALLVQRTLAGPVTLAERAREWLEGTEASWDANARVWRFPSGASLDFGHERYLYLAGE